MHWCLICKSARHRRDECDATEDDLRALGHQPINAQGPQGQAQSKQDKAWVRALCTEEEVGSGMGRQGRRHTSRAPRRRDPTPPWQPRAPSPEMFSPTASSSSAA